MLTVTLIFLCTQTPGARAGEDDSSLPGCNRKVICRGNTKSPRIQPSGKSYKELEIIGNIKLHYP